MRRIQGTQHKSWDHSCDDRQISESGYKQPQMDKWIIRQQSHRSDSNRNFFLYFYLWWFSPSNAINMEIFCQRFLQESHLPDSRDKTDPITEPRPTIRCGRCLEPPTGRCKCGPRPQTTRMSMHLRPYLENSGHTPDTHTAPANLSIGRLV